MGKKKLRIALTAGDPFGVGPELSLAAARDAEEEVTLYGDPAQLRGAAKLVAIPIEGERPERPGPSAAGGRAALAALERAMEDVRAGRQDALVTAPISKESCALAGAGAGGHTPLLGRFFGVAEPLMSFVWDENEPVVALLTVHIPLRAVAASLTSAKVERAALVLHDALRARFRRAEARVGILGLNPHAGEGGRLGSEEADHIAPAVERLRSRGMQVSGPLPGDTAFAVRERFDGLLALYHDQGLAPVKALAFRRAVNVTLGLPIVRTSPAHGTAFDLAGSGRADPSSLRAALAWASRLAR
ncbi:MAG: PdxA family dehydrogenase [Planctomycetaceae bacterium]